MTKKYSQIVQNSKSPRPHHTVNFSIFFYLQAMEFPSPSFSPLSSPIENFPPKFPRFHIFGWISHRPPNRNLNHTWAWLFFTLFSPNFYLFGWLFRGFLNICMLVAQHGGPTSARNNTNKSEPTSKKRTEECKLMDGVYRQLTKIVPGPWPLPRLAMIRVRAAKWGCRCPCPSIADRWWKGAWNEGAFSIFFAWK